MGSLLFSADFTCFYGLCLRFDLRVALTFAFDRITFALFIGIIRFFRFTLALCRNLYILAEN